MMKTYQSLQYMKLILTVEVNGVGIECAFKGGKYYPVKENGTYRTGNKGIQKALEEHEFYGKSFVLIKTTEEEAITEPVKVTPKAETTVPSEEVKQEIPKAKEAVTAPVATPDGTIQVNEVPNSQEAKLYLNKHFSVPFSRLKNTEMIMNEAKAANLTFPNWKH